MASETGWVIELYIGSVLHYWTGGSCDDMGWRPEHESAIRFAREVDAKTVQCCLLHRAGRVTEHAWEVPDDRKA